MGLQVREGWAEWQIDLAVQCLCHGMDDGSEGTPDVGRRKSKEIQVRQFQVHPRTKIVGLQIYPKAIV